VKTKATWPIAAAAAALIIDIDMWSSSLYFVIIIFSFFIHSFHFLLLLLFFQWFVRSLAALELSGRKEGRKEVKTKTRDRSRL
jgi:hypothetical protein